MRGKIERLQKILDESRYTVAICGSGMMEEGGFVGVKHPERAYEIEEKYGDSPEEISQAFIIIPGRNNSSDFIRRKCLK